METDIHKLDEFRCKTYKKLMNTLITSEIMSESEVNSLIHALVDISESLEKSYFEIIPDLIKRNSKDKERINDLLDNLRDEFSHILYHIKDSKLYDLDYSE